MNWIYGLCSCITPNFGLRQTMINYLNSQSLNRKIFEIEKTIEQDHQPEDQQDDNHVYAYAKTKSYNFMKLQAKSDDQQQQNQLQNHKDQRRQQQDEIIDVFWYPKQTNNHLQRGELYMKIYKHKHRLFNIMIQQQPNSCNYDKIYDSQDQIDLKIYCRLQSLIKGKRLNSFRFTFLISGIKLQQIEQSMKQAKEKQLVNLLEEKKLIQQNKEQGYEVYQRFFKKLLVISPHNFTTFEKTQKIDSIDQKSISILVFSVQNNDEEVNKNNNSAKGWLHLAGLQFTESQKGVFASGYLCLQLNLSISPNMLKQPISKQIRNFVQKIVCTVKKSDQI